MNDPYQGQNNDLINRRFDEHNMMLERLIELMEGGLEQ